MSTGEWYKQGANQNKKLVALATALKQKRAKNKKSPGNPTISATSNPATEPGNVPWYWVQVQVVQYSWQERRKMGTERHVYASPP